MINRAAGEFGIGRNFQSRIVEERRTLSHQVFDNAVDTVFVNSRVKVAVVGESHNTRLEFWSTGTLNDFKKSDGFFSLEYCNRTTSLVKDSIVVAGCRR